MASYPASKPGSQRHTLSVLVENRPGVLARIAGLFARRAFNINSLSVSPTERPDISRITVTADVEEVPLEQIIKQLHKLISTYKVIDSGEFVEREMVLLKISLNEDFSGLDAVLKSANGTVTSSNEDYIIVMACDEADRIENFIKVMKKYNPSQIVRSGSVMMEL